ncbi:ComF family protein [Sphingomicrobium nitratireducens]|uniref:ComF family protein n=1 Tax=Sphingomicrobium nitratireducens TaxID=2964666 RepID=UPI00223F5BFF|nr:ComF family protein [Sphingomicrobium nitratireducens]
MLSSLFGRLGRGLLDFALPARCASCGEIVEHAGSFCSACWTSIDWIGTSGCTRCAMPLEATEQDQCLACESDPPLIEATSAATRYGETSRALALKLKYGRRVALAKAMAAPMARSLEGADRDALLVPVPLHRGRLWQRGFNQAALLARELSRRSGLENDPFVLERTRATRPMTDMTPAQRHKNVRGAFAVVDRSRIEGRTVILVDDVRTSGSTLEACARALLKGGARRVEANLWARVVRPRRLAR